MAGGLGGGFARPLRRLSILVDVQDQATAQMAALNGAGMKLGNTFNTTAAAGRNMKMMLAGAVAAAGLTAIAMRRITRLGTELDSTFATIGTAANATDEEMRAIVATTREIGAEMPVTLSEVSRAFEQFMYAGFDAAEAIAAADNAVELAIAGNLDMQQAVETTATLMNAFNIDAQDTAAITETLGATFADHAIDIESLGNAMRYVSASANQLGFDLAETAAAIGVLADNGIRGTMAGTSLNQAMMQLVDPSDKAADAMRQVGLSIEDFTDEEGNMISMVEMVEKLDDHIGHLGERQRGAWLQRVFGIRGGRAMEPLIDNVEDLEEAIMDRARAQLQGAIDDAEELSEVERARLEILMETGDLEWAREQIADMEDEEVIEWAEEVDADVDPSEFDNAMDFFESMREEVHDGSVEVDQLEQYLMAMGVEAEAAGELADEIGSDRDLDEIAEEFEDVVGASALSAAQLNTLGGRFEYLRGSISSVLYLMYTGFRPMLIILADAFIAWADLLNEHPRLLQAVGVGMFFLTSAVGVFLAMMLKTWASQSMFVMGLKAQAVAMKGATAAAWMHVKAMALTNKYYEMKGGNVTVLLKRLHYYIAGKWRAVTAEHGHVKGLALATKALFVKAAAAAYATVMMAPMLSVFIALTIIMVAYQKDLFGVRSAIDALLGPTSGLIEKVIDLVNWFRNLNATGQALIGAFVFFIPVVGQVIAVAIVLYMIVSRLPAAFRWLRDAVSGLIPSLDLSIGAMDAVSGALSRVESFLRTAGGQFDQLTQRIQSFIVRGLMAIPRAIMAALSGGASLVRAGLEAMLGPFARLLPSSDAAEGPLANLTSMAMGIPRTIASAILNGGPAILKESMETLLGWATKPITNVLGQMRDLMDIFNVFDRLSPFSALERTFEALDDTLGPVVESLRKIYNRLEEIDDEFGISDITFGSQEDAIAAGEATREEIQAWLDERFGGGPDDTRGSAGERDPRDDDDDDRDTGREPSIDPRSYLPGEQTIQRLSRTSSTREYAYTDSGGTTIDARRVVIEQSPHIDIDTHGGGPSQDSIQRQIERGMDQARTYALEDFYDFLTLGSPDRFTGDGAGMGTGAGGDDFFGEGDTDPAEGEWDDDSPEPDDPPPEGGFENGDDDTTEF